MAGPQNQQVISLFIPPGESQQQFPVEALARDIENLEYTPEGTLRSIAGPTLYEPERGAQVLPYRSTEIHSLFHTLLQGGIVDMLLVRWGSKLYWHNGWSRSFVETSNIHAFGSSGTISSERRASYPDQYAVLNDRIIWTNGVDRARVITFEGVTFPLGFSSPAPTPQSLSPIPLGGINEGNSYTAGRLTEAENGSAGIAYLQHEPNAFGYSWPGRVGTVGDELDGSTGAVLAGVWFYYTQLEDFHGNLGPLSGPSNPVQLTTASASPPMVTKNPRWAANGQMWKPGDPATANDLPIPLNAPDPDNTQIADLLKQFAVMVGGTLPSHCRAVHLYRSRDIKRSEGTPLRVARIPGARAQPYPDDLPDEYLGSPASAVASVPVFRVMCVHEGRLIIGNTPGAPGIVRRSEPGLAGTFLEGEFVYPDAGAVEVTSLVSHAGMLLAFTATGVFSLSDFGAPQTLAQGIGCVAPRSTVAMPDGRLIWLGLDGFYGLVPGSAIERISDPIDRTTHNFLNRSRLRMAAAAYSHDANEYQCAVASAGSSENDLMLCFGLGGWRRRLLGLSVRDMCTTKDFRRYTLLAARELKGITKTGAFISPFLSTNDVYVADRETVAYTPPDRVSRYRSNWLRAEKSALTPFFISMMYVGMLDAFDGDITVRFYRNGSWAEVIQVTDLLAVGPDDGTSIVSDQAGQAVVGTARTRDPRLFWRSVPMQLKDARIWAFELSVPGTREMHLASIGFDVSVVTGGNVNRRTPRRSDR